MIYTEMTPNPASLKFKLGRVLLPKGSADFPDISSAAEAPIAKKLFDFKFVERVFIGNDFLTITKADDFQWEEVIPVVKDYLKAFFASGQDPLVGSYADMAAVPAEEEDELTQKIKSILETYVRPAVAMDGGDIVYESFHDGILKVKLQGSCSGCPSSTITLKGGIENLLARMAPEVKSVEAV
ncbi:MAG: NifU family protein [Bacteroidota bacterium]